VGIKSRNIFWQLCVHCYQKLSGIQSLETVIRIDAFHRWIVSVERIQKVWIEMASQLFAAKDGGREMERSVWTKNPEVFMKTFCTIA